MKAIMRRFRPEQLRELVIVLLIVVLILFFGTQINGYLTGRTFNRVSTSVAIIAVVAVGQTLVVLARNIDLSVGSIVGVTAYFVGTLLSQEQRDPTGGRGAHGDGDGRGDGIAQRGVGGLRPCSGHHHHAGHTGALPLAPGAVLGFEDRAHQRDAGMDAETAPGERLQHRRLGRAPDRGGRDCRRDPVPVGADLSAFWPAALCHRLQPGCCQGRGLPGAAHRVPLLRAVRHALSGWPASCT